METYEICWNILRFKKHLPTTKMKDTHCPCGFDPVNNPHCPGYEAVVVRWDNAKVQISEGK